MSVELTWLIALPFAAAFAVSMAFAPGVIGMLKRQKMGQTISEDGPESHRPKAGTPTMGGLIIVAGVLAGALATTWVLLNPSLAGPLSGGLPVAPHTVFAVLVLVLSFAVLGLVDDYLTIHPIGGVRGIASKPKAALQVLLAAGFLAWLGTGVQASWFSPMLYIAGHPVLVGWSYWVFAGVFIVGMANFVNITDGLDGLVSGLTAIAALAIVAIVLLVPPFTGAAVAQMLAVLVAIAGACIAFLWFNANPAKVFMGDTGALALGVALPAIAVLAHREVLLIVVGLVFVLDGLSSALQWAVFKYTRVTTGTGRRVFKKSPIHHHFELSGWPEQTVVVRFWIMGVVAALVGFVGAVWRWW